MDIGRAIGYPFKDSNWIIKTLIGTVIAIIPIVNFIGTGYLVRAIQAMQSGNEEQLPEWDDFGGDFVRGLTVLVGWLIYYIPIFIVSCILGIVGGIVGGEDGNILSALISCCSSLISLGYWAIVFPMLALSIVKFAETNDFSASFLNFGAHFGTIQSHVGETFMFLLFAFALYIGLGIGFFVTIWLCGLGLALIFLGSMIGGNLMNQYAMQVSDKTKNGYVTY